VKVNNVNDFINKLCKAEIITKFLSQSDLEFGGIRQLIIDFLGKVKIKLMEDTFLAEEVEIHVAEIHEYVMFQLHHEFFKLHDPSDDEIRFQ
jgi:hypothetical protein